MCQVLKLHSEMFLYGVTPFIHYQNGYFVIAINNETIQRIPRISLTYE